MIKVAVFDDLVQPSTVVRTSGDYKVVVVVYQKVVFNDMVAKLRCSMIWLQSLGGVQ